MDAARSLGTPPSVVLPPEALAPAFEVPGRPGVQSSFSPGAYQDAVRRVVEHIRAGDVFQVNLAQRLMARQTQGALETYGRLRERNPAPFAGFFDAGGAAVLSASPERFLRADGDRIETRPIKGTRPRGRTGREDQDLREELRSSEKDRAENVMIVDLLRNDLSRVCRLFSVEAPELFRVETYRTVHQLVSVVRGRLRQGLGPLDLLRAAFPGGSITGAPKIRAMEIIAALEPVARGPYCGSLAWIGFDGSMDSSILIRTLTAAQGWLQLPAGGGITAPSDPEAEYVETLHKAEGMMLALE
jgi:para-aminobenzoate synthetase component 1